MVANTWTWVSGDNISDQLSIYGTKGVANINNIPGSRVDSALAIDKVNQVIWLFGGNGLDSNGASGLLNDLWRYDMVANTWTWVAGSQLINQAGVFGIKGVPGANNIPSAVSKAHAWVDHSGNFWLFGGNQSDSNTNILWKYNPNNNTWTWVSGITSGNTEGYFGIKGVIDSNNTPPSMTALSSCVDNNGNLWMFGGKMCISSSGNCGNSDAVWSYNV